MCATEFSIFPYKLKEGKGKHCSRKCYELYKRTIPAWNKGKPSPWAIGNQWRKGKSNLNPHKMIAQENPKWKGDSVGYFGLHNWVRYHKGKPQFCERCGSANEGIRKYHWANISHKYLRDLNDWIRLCVSCHKKYDAGKIKL